MKYSAFYQDEASTKDQLLLQRKQQTAQLETNLYIIYIQNEIFFQKIRSQNISHLFVK